MELRTIRRRSRNADAVTVLQALLDRGGYEAGLDGRFGRQTEAAVERFQRDHQLVIDGVVGPKTWTRLIVSQPDFFEEIAFRFLSEQDLIDEARRLDLDLAVIKAVHEVESRGVGFLAGRPKILFEGHRFWKQLQHHGIDPEDRAAGNEDILHPTWSRRYYRGGLAEYHRLRRAELIHADAAMESASWGAYQIMGFNHRLAGFASVRDFVRAHERHERDHLRAFGRFLETRGLLTALREQDWPAFALGYNGSDFREHDYDGRLRRAWERYR